MALTKVTSGIRTLATNEVTTDIIEDGTVTSAKIVDGAIVNADINASAAIAQSKLSLDITNSDINASAAIAQSKLSLDITNSEINASAAIALSKLNVTGTGSSSNFLRGDGSWNSAGVDTLSALTDVTVSTSDPTISTNPSAVGHYWVNKSTGNCWVCTDATSNSNQWTNVGNGSQNISPESPIQQHDNCWWYTRFDEAASVASSAIQNQASGSNAVTGITIPVSGGTRGSSAGSYTMSWGSQTNGCRTNFSNADPFGPSTHGMTVGALFKKETGSGARGVIYYGDTGSDNHFFWRTDLYTANTLAVGEDTGTSDTWTDAFTGINDSTWYFLVVKISTDGTLSASKNGAAFSTARSGGTAPTPTDAVFGIQGDPYDDNAAQHEFASFFFYKGLMTDSQVSAEYDYLADIWSI